MIFGGIYYDNKNHQIANAYSYAGSIPLWLSSWKYPVKRWLLERKYEWLIWRLKFKVRKY